MFDYWTGHNLSELHKVIKARSSDLEKRSPSCQSRIIAENSGLRNAEFFLQCFAGIKS
jgi:hypothetical protein